MASFAKMSREASAVLREGGVWVPCPLPLNARKRVEEDWLRLLTLYYFRSGARCVVPGAHTGEFAGYDVLPPAEHYALYGMWLDLVRDMTKAGGTRRLLLAMAHDLKHVEMCAERGYDAVVVSPKCFRGMEGSVRRQLRRCRDIATVLPVFGFYLQKAAGGIEFSREFWSGFFEFAVGAKLAPFDRYRTLTALEAAAASRNRKRLTLMTGNDDHIVGDLMRDYVFWGHPVAFEGGLLGHYATDTRAAVRWTGAVLDARAGRGTWPLPIPVHRVLDAVTLCNMALFDAFPNSFKSAIWGVKCRLASLGLLKAPTCYRETGNGVLRRSIEDRYEGEYKAVVSDRAYVREHLAEWKREAGVR
jgi:hypothetical protein